MINELHLENLKSFAGKHRMELAPITLVYGPNSAGKSSLIQALALLKQTVAASVRQDSEDPEPVFSGDYVDLGSFMTSVHRHDAGRALGVGLRFRDPMPEAATRDSPLAQEKIYAGLRFALRDGVEGIDGNRARQEQAILGDKDDLLEFRRVREERFEFADGRGPAMFLRLIESREQLHRQLKTPDEELEADNLRLVATEVRRIFDTGARPQFLSTGLFPALPAPGFVEGDRNLDMMLGLWFEEYLYSRARMVTEILDRLAYLGPMRSLPSRFQLLAGSAVETVGFTGENTTWLLWSRRNLLDSVNAWLGRLGQRYELAVLPLGVHGQPEPHSQARTIQIGDLVTTALIDVDSDMAVTPRDVGFGISQLLPIVVQLLVNRNGTICIEQPEVHIHPRLQAEVADLLIKSAQELGNQVIVETHSESLVLRIQRRIAEGSLRPEDVSVLYVKEPEEMKDSDGVLTRSAVTQPLPLNENGYFTEEWPGGFFAERRDDIFSRSRASASGLAFPPDEADVPWND